MATPLELQFTGSRTSIRQLATSIRQPDCLALAAASKGAGRAAAASSKRAAATTKELAARPPQRVRELAARLQQRLRRQQACGAGREAAAACAAEGACGPLCGRGAGGSRRAGRASGCGAGGRSRRVVQVAAAGEREEEDTMCSISPTDVLVPPTKYKNRTGPTLQPNTE